MSAVDAQALGSGLLHYVLSTVCAYSLIMEAVACCSGCLGK